MRLTKNLFLVSVLFFSCQNKVFEDYRSFENQKWPSDSSVVFTHKVTDTISKNRITIKVRHTTDYEFQNLFLFVKTNKTDTVELVLANKEGRWLGKGVGDIRELDYVYEKEKKFLEKKVFVFEIEQAMRYGEVDKIKELENIQAVGITIDKHD